MDIKKNEATAALRRVYMHCTDATDGLTPETGEAGGQPQIGIAGAAFGNSAGVLVAMGNGRYYFELSQAESNQAHRTIIESRYKSANTSETVGSIVQIIDPMADIVEDTLTLKDVLRILLAVLAGKSTGSGTPNVAFRDVGDAKDRVAATLDTGDRTAISLDVSD